ncbi:hypothetical protein ACFVR2_19380 [Gottfriedia sp. NPDC057991]|uniref:hypothetical protein n=1 Tax=Gottfriedia sp. NPDC057991 TaxID=3346298 RepID=UPI0036DED55A
MRRKNLILHSKFKTPQILSEKNDIKWNTLSIKSQKLSTIIEKFTGVSINRNSSATLLINGDEMFSKLKEALLDAKNYIYIQYYIFRADTIGS